MEALESKHMVLAPWCDEEEVRRRARLPKGGVACVRVSAACARACECWRRGVTRRRCATDQGACAVGPARRVQRSCVLVPYCCPIATQCSLPLTVRCLVHAPQVEEDVKKRSATSAAAGVWAWGRVACHVPRGAPCTRAARPPSNAGMCWHHRHAPCAGAKTLCIPFDQPELPAGTLCFASGKPAKNWALWGRSY